MKHNNFKNNKNNGNKKWNNLPWLSETNQINRSLIPYKPSMEPKNKKLNKKQSKNHKKDKRERKKSDFV